MKTQMTVIAAAVAMAVSFSSQARDFENSTTTPAANLGSNPAFVNQQDIREGMNGFARDPMRTSIIVQTGNNNAAETDQHDDEQYSRVGQR